MRQTISSREAKIEAIMIVVISNGYQILGFSISKRQNN